MVSDVFAKLEFCLYWVGRVELAFCWIVLLLDVLFFAHSCSPQSPCPLLPSRSLPPTLPQTPQQPDCPARPLILALQLQPPFFLIGRVRAGECEMRIPHLSIPKPSFPQKPSISPPFPTHTKFNYPPNTPLPTPSLKSQNPS